nr:5-formyltetrahydrofolate cyclo-ligase [Pyrobaculum calidifontis]
MVKEVKRAIRERVWRVLEERGVAAFPRPVFGRIPNFRGAEEACARLVATPEFAAARVVKVNPDAPQRPCRRAALERGKVLIMPTPRIREGFLLLDPSEVKDPAEASTIAGAFKWGRGVKPWDLPRVDLVVVGSVAVDPRTGRRLGKSHGYAEIEWGLLTLFGKAGEETPVATTVHDLQLVEEVPREPFDLPVDIVATPTRLIRVRRVDAKPRGIYWEYVTEEMLREIPLLGEVRRRIGTG